ncbi:hypothetical protein ACOSQ4_021108 [Xanthoceras sorbifolium]
MTKEAGLQLGSKVGKVKDIDTGASGECMGKYLRIRVNIDISKPLLRGIRVSLDESEESMMLLIRYERLPEFCFGCGLVGHQVRECPSVPRDAEFVQTDHQPFGPWLRASNSGLSRPVRSDQERGVWRQQRRWGWKEIAICRSMWGWLVRWRDPGLPGGMKILCWNVRGLGTYRTFQVLRTRVRECRPDLVFLMETLSNKDRMEQLRLFLGFSGKLVVECVGRSGGLVLFWSNQLDINLLSFSLFHIDVSVSVARASPWRFTGFYGSPEVSQRHNAWLLLKRLCGMSSLPWICGGDFNEILMDCEKDGGLPKQRRLLLNFREALDACGLQDLGFEGPLFTWCNGRVGNAFVQERLDRYVCSRDWLSLFPASYVQHLDFWKSDHRPILLHIAVQGSVLRCSASLGRWNSLNRASLRRGINTKRLELASLNRSVSAGSWRDIRLVEKELDALLLQEEIYWRQRSRVSWLKFGDRNSKFFHAKASARRKVNEILGLSDERGCWHSDPGSVHRIVCEYFSSIFSSSAPSPETLRRVTQVVEPRVSSSMNALLDAKFSAEEVRQALFLMYPTKAPGVDGMPALFFQNCSLAGDAMVASLKSASGAWDSALVRSSFAPIDADCILSLPTSVRSCPDKLMWHHSKDGMYSVKSGYWLAASLARDGASSSSPSAGSSWWKFLWGLNIPAKVWMFVWRACRNLLPTRSLLAARRVPVGAGSLAESKAAVPFLASLRLLAAGSFLDFISACFSTLLVHEMELFAPLLSVEDTVGWSERFLVDFQAAAAVPSVRCELVVERWLAPSPGWFKINSDVAVDVRGRRLGFGVVIRNCTGKVLVSYTSLLLGFFSSDIGEALAILRGLRLAIDMDDILSLVVNFADLSFSSVRRSANIVAHGLAKFALSHQPVGVRLGSVPSSLALVVLDDSRGYP